MSALKTTILIIAVIWVISGYVDLNNNRSIDDDYTKSFEVAQERMEKSASLKQQKIELIEKIAKQYHDTHIYKDDNVFDCDNMAQDVWDMLQAQGINAELVLGNVDSNALSISLDDVNHVWVVAEIEPSQWLAVETTGGYIVTDDENYLRGYFFKNPKSYRDFIYLYKDYKFQLADYQNEIDYYNRLVNIYNNANGYEQLGMKSGMQVVKMNLEEKKRRSDETRIKIDTILEYG